MKLISSLNVLACFVKNRGFSKTFWLVFAYICFCCSISQAQTHLEIESRKLIGSRTSTINSYQTINIKTKSAENLKALVVTGFSDSAFLFKDHAPLAFSAVQRITLVGDRPLCSLFGKFFKRFGLAFFALNTINQAITGNTPVVQIQALYIGGSIYAVGLVLRSFENKRIHVKTSTKFTTIQVNYSEIK